MLSVDSFEPAPLTIKKTKTTTPDLTEGIITTHLSVQLLRWKLCRLFQYLKA